MGYWLLGLVFCCASAQGFVERPALLQAPVLTASDIVTSLEKNPDQTIDSFLLTLPVTYRRHFVLQYLSHSRHSATHQSPRIIFFGPDAKLLMGVSGNPNDANFNSLELIEYRPQTATYDFYQIDFAAGQKPSIKVNPQDCRRCHGPDQKPNWESYSIWPGTYGSLHDRIPHGSIENSEFKKFVTTFSTRERYRSLVTPFFASSTFQDTQEFYLNNGGAGPGASLSILAGYLNRDRIAKKLVSLKDHDRYRPAITAALIDCPEPIETFLPPSARHPVSFTAVEKDTAEWYFRSFKRQIRVTASLLGVNEDFVLPHASETGRRPEEMRRIARLRYLLDNRETDPIGFDRWSLSISKTAFDFEDGVNGLENLIGHYLPLAYEPTETIALVLPVEAVPFAFTSLGKEEYKHHQSNERANKDAYLMEAFKIKDLSALGVACPLLQKEAAGL